MNADTEDGECSYFEDFGIRPGTFNKSWHGQQIGPSHLPTSEDKRPAGRPGAVAKRFLESESGSWVWVTLQ